MITQNKTILHDLISSTGGVHVTAYFVNRPNAKPLRIQIAEALTSASKIIRPVMSRSKREEFLKPLTLLLSKLGDLEFTKGNIGFFRTERTWHVVSLPVEVETSCTVATSFHVKPILRWLQSDRDFVLVGFERGAVYIYSGNQHSMNHLDTLLNVDAEITAQKIKEACERLKTSKSKLFLVGAKKHVEAVRSKLPLGLSSNSIHWTGFKTSHVSRLYREVRDDLRRDVEATIMNSFLDFEYAQKLDITENNVFRIARAATQGRVKKLLISEDVHLFGKFDRMTGGLSLHHDHLDHEDDCVLDDIAQTVIHFGGEVVVAKQDKVPGGHYALAITEPSDPLLKSKKLNRIKQKHDHLFS